MHRRLATHHGRFALQCHANWVSVGNAKALRGALSMNFQLTLRALIQLVLPLQASKTRSRTKSKCITSLRHLQGKEGCH